MSRGKFIVLEGSDGAGKDTQIHYLKEKFNWNGVITTREPGGTGLGMKLRDLLLSNKSFDMSFKTELLLYYADRAHHIEKVIIPAIEGGSHVISNRFSLSTIAYQIYGKQKLDYLDFALSIDQYIVGKYTPDLYIFMDVDPENARVRINSSHGEADRYESEGMAFHARVREGYMKHLKEHPHFIVNTNRSVEEVQEEIYNLVKIYLDKWDGDV